MKKSRKIKLHVVQLFLSGMPLRAIEREFGVDRKDVSEWARRYDMYGEGGLDRKKHSKTTYEDRCNAVKEYVDQGRTYRELVDKYDVSRALLKKLVAKYRAGGFDALNLKEKPRGRPCK